MTHCGEPVPECLRGTLRPAKCMLELGPDGRHAGDHKAHATILRVGRVTFRWKQGHTCRVEAAPVVMLPHATNPYLTGKNRRR